MVVSDDKTRVMITISKDLREELEKEAKLENRSLSNYLLHVIQNRKK